MNSTFYPSASDTAILILGRKDYNRDPAQKTAHTVGKMVIYARLTSGQDRLMPGLSGSSACLLWGLWSSRPNVRFEGAKRTVSTTRKRKWVQGLSPCPPEALLLAPLKANPPSISQPPHARRLDHAAPSTEG